MFHPRSLLVLTLAVLLTTISLPSTLANSNVDAARLGRTGRSAAHLSFYPFINGSFTHETKLSANNQAQVDNFGTAIAIDSNTAVVSGLGNRFSGYPDGVIYVYVREGASWTLQQTLSASDDEAQADDSFGFSVAINGDTIVVGALGDCDGGFIAGAAYVYVRTGTTWALQQKLIASDAADFANLGISVAVNGDTVVAGAYGDDDAGYFTGAAYVFHRQGTIWTEQQKLTASDAAPDNGFGQHVAISHDTIAIGAPSNSSDKAHYSGAVYVFIHNGSGWTEQQKLKARDAAESQQLGYCVAISGDTIVASAPGEIVGMHTYGAAYIFERNGTNWSEQKKIIDRDTARTDGFALRVAIDGDTIVLGDTADNEAAVWGGVAYVYTRRGNAGWSLHQTLSASDAAFLDFLGSTVAISGNTIMVGAPHKDELTTESGAVYIYD
jgi:hypothetical protein